MTDREKAIVMAYTGVTMLTGDKLMIFYRYLEDIMGRPVYSHELGFIDKEIRQKSLDDFIKLCETTECEQTTLEDTIIRQAVLKTLDDMDNVLDEDRTIENYKELLKECYDVLPSVKPQEQTRHWIEHEHNGILHIECSECLTWFLRAHLLRNSYCPNCGARMSESRESEEK